MKRLVHAALEALVFALLLSVLTARAQVPECEPRTQFNPTAAGSELVWTWTADGVAASWWCLGLVDGTPRAQGFTYGGRYADGWEAARAAAPRVYAAASPWVQFKLEAAAIGSAMTAAAAGSLLECQRKAIRHTACIALHTATFDPPLPAVITKAQALAPDRCGPAPVCAPLEWTVDAATSADGTRPAYALANGARASASTGRAKAGQPCRPEVAQAPSLTTGTLWAAYGPDFAPGMVALCRKAP